MNEDVRSRLIEVATGEGTIFYSELAALAALDPNGTDFNVQIGSVLDAISRYEHSNGRPLLSAVVISRRLSMPGTGFYSLARELHMMAGLNNLAFWTAELDRVYQCWRSQSVDL